MTLRFFKDFLLLATANDLSVTMMISMFTNQHMKRDNKNKIEDNNRI